MTDTPATGSRRPERGAGSSAGPDPSATGTPPPASDEDRAGGQVARPAPAESPGPPAGADEAPSGASAAPVEPENLLAHTRASQTWIAIIVFAVVLVLLLIFILENTKRVPITYFGVTGHLPLAVAMLLAAAAAVLLTATAGTLRIVQLRRRVRRGQRAVRRQAREG